jgi:hypothetical protein
VSFLRQKWFWAWTINENKKLERSIIWKIFMDIIIVNKNKKCQYSKEKNRNKGKWVLHILKETCDHNPAYIPKKKSTHDDFSKKLFASSNY